MKIGLAERKNPSKKDILCIRLEITTPRQHRAQQIHNHHRRTSVTQLTTLTKTRAKKHTKCCVCFAASRIRICVQFLNHCNSLITISIIDAYKRSVIALRFVCISLGKWKQFVNLSHIVNKERRNERALLVCISFALALNAISSILYLHRSISLNSHSVFHTTTTVYRSLPGCV